MNVRRYPRTLSEAFPNTPEYASPFAGYPPMKQSTRSRIFRALLWTCISAVLFVFIAAVLLGVHRVSV